MVNFAFDYQILIFLMVQNKSLSASYSKSIAVNIETDLSQEIVSKTVRSASKFAFINLSQWLLLLLLNGICLSFVIFSCAWIV